MKALRLSSCEDRNLSGYYWQQRILPAAGFLLLSCLLAFGSGCHTYLGYHEFETSADPKREVVESAPHHQLNLAVLPYLSASLDSLDAQVSALTENTVRVRTEYQTTRRDKYLEYNGKVKTGEVFWCSWASLLFGPFYLLTPTIGQQYQFVFPPADLAAKSTGYPGFHGPGLMDLYDENPPEYWTRVSQNTLTGFFNPFQCMMNHYPDQIVFEESPVEGADRVEETMLTETAQVYPEGLTIKVSCPRIPDRVLTATTDQEGKASISMLPWRPYLRPGLNLNVTLTTTSEGLAAASEIVVPTDELIPALDSVIQEEGMAEQDTTQTESDSAPTLGEVASSAESHE